MNGSQLRNGKVGVIDIIESGDPQVCGDPDTLGDTEEMIRTQKDTPKVNTCRVFIKMMF